MVLPLATGLGNYLKALVVMLGKPFAGPRINSTTEGSEEGLSPPSQTLRSG
jgi:hypothetical protein